MGKHRSTLLSTRYKLQDIRSWVHSGQFHVEKLKCPVLQGRWASERHEWTYSFQLRLHVVFGQGAQVIQKGAKTVCREFVASLFRAGFLTHF